MLLSRQSPLPNALWFPVTCALRCSRNIDRCVLLHIHCPYRSCTPFSHTLYIVFVRCDFPWACTVHRAGNHTHIVWHRVLFPCNTHTCLSFPKIFKWKGNTYSPRNKNQTPLYFTFFSVQTQNIKSYFTLRPRKYKVFEKQQANELGCIVHGICYANT